MFRMSRVRLVERNEPRPEVDSNLAATAAGRCACRHRPVITRPQELPFDRLTWENFERLCFRLVQREADVEHCQMYGARGQDQQGIDIYARSHSGTGYRVYQCRRVERFGPASIRDAITDFLQGKWAQSADTFVLCTSHTTVATQYADEIEKQAQRL